MNISAVKKKIDDNIATIELLEESYDDEIKLIIEQELNSIDQELNDVSLEVLLSEPYDKNNAILEIHAGAGGTEACDWANMLNRMYLRWCEIVVII